MNVSMARRVAISLPLVVAALLPVPFAGPAAALVSLPSVSPTPQAIVHASTDVAVPPQVRLVADADVGAPTLALVEDTFADAGATITDTGAGLTVRVGALAAT